MKSINPKQFSDRISERMSRWWCLLAFLAFSLIAPFGAYGQYTRGYVFVSPGGLTSAGTTQSLFSLGGGAERLLSRGIGAGAEVGAVFPGNGPIKDTSGLFSLNGYYHFKSDERLDPFLTAGYSVLFRSSTENMVNFGGGATYWFHDNRGLLLEFRDHVGSPKSGPTGNYWEFRIGLTFR